MAQPILKKVLLAVGLALSAEAAQAQALVAQLYPLTGDAKAAAAIKDAQNLVESAFTTYARRSERLVPAEPLVMKAVCGRVPGADCLAPLAAGGVVIWGTARADKTDIVITLHAVDGRAEVHGPVQTRVDGFLQSAEPIVNALLELEKFIPADAGGAVAAATGPAGKNGKGARTVAPGTSLKMKEHRSGGSGMRTAGKWATGGGLLLLAGGATVAVLNQQLAADLTDRYRDNALTTGDASKYDRMDTYNELSKALFIAGGALTATGVVLWGLAPDARPLPGGMTLGLQGRF